MAGMFDPNAPCPCGRRPPGKPAAPGLRYGACCGRWHAGPSALQAPDAESLMRSRYCAYVLDLADYLLATWHPDTRPEGIEANERGQKWLGLDIKRQVVQDANHASVEFVARTKLNGRAFRLHENSRFERIEAPGQAPRWLYLDGDPISAD
jgi:SEC-C motif domain protein